MSLRIFHTADHHGCQGGYREIAGLRNPDTDLHLDAGDTLHGSNTSFRWHEENLSLLSKVGCEAMSMGNRELHYLWLVRERRARQMTFPLLAANLVELWGRPTTWTTGITLERAGKRIGIFGMTVVQYPVGSLYEQLFGLRFLEPETLIEPMARRYRATHDVVVFLAHLGLARDRELAYRLRKRPECRIDLILGGHSHHLITEPERVGETYLSHIGAHGSHYGVWRNGSLGWEFELQTVDGTE